MPTVRDASVAGGATGLAHDYHPLPLSHSPWQFSEEIKRRAWYRHRPIAYLLMLGLLMGGIAVFIFIASQFSDVAAGRTPSSPTHIDATPRAAIGASADIGIQASTSGAPAIEVDQHESTHVPAALDAGAMDASLSASPSPGDGTGGVVVMRVRPAVPGDVSLTASEPASGPQR